MVVLVLAYPHRYHGPGRDLRHYPPAPPLILSLTLSFTISLALSHPPPPLRGTGINQKYFFSIDDWAKDGNGDAGEGGSVCVCVCVCVPMRLCTRNLFLDSKT